MATKLLVQFVFVFFFLVGEAFSQSSEFIQPQNGEQFEVNQPYVVQYYSSTGYPVYGTQTCGQYAGTFEISNSDRFLLSPPNNYIGNCGLTTSDGGSVGIKFYGTVSFSSPDQSPQETAAAGTSIEVVLNINPSNGSPTQLFTVQLDCNNPDFGPVTASYIDFQTSIQFPIPEFFYGTNCVFSIPALQQNFQMVYPETATITVTQPLTIISPTSGEVSLYPEPLEILVQGGSPGIQVPITVRVSCPEAGSVDEFIMTSSVVNNKALNTGFYETCDVEIRSAPAYFVIGPSVSFSRKFEVEFEVVPSTLYIGAPFAVKIVANGSPPSIPLETVYLFLGSGNTALQIWENVPIDTLTQLQVSLDLVPQNDLLLFALVNTNIYVVQEASVNLQFLVNPPFGGRFYPITQDQINTFLASIIFKNPVDNQ
jgi:hypothetical protein